MPQLGSDTALRFNPANGAERGKAVVPLPRSATELGGCRSRRRRPTGTRPWWANPNGWPTTAWFQWGGTTNYGNLSSVADLGSGTTASPLSAPLAGLTRGVTYHFRVAATNDYGLVCGSDQSFTTLAVPVGSALTYTVLKNFTGSDGQDPDGGLVLAGSTLYGTASVGGSSGNGVVFKMNTDGSGYTVLKNFAGSDGSAPVADLLLSGNTLYGTTDMGGNYDGVVFKMNTDGSGYTLLKNFTLQDGFALWGGLVLSGSTLYGTTSEGGGSGGNGVGVVFKVNTDASGFAVLSSSRAAMGEIRIMVTWCCRAAPSMGRRRMSSR